MVTNILLLIRIKDWLKNIVIFLPLIFSGNLSKIDLYQNLLFSFIIFSFISTFLYIINDIIDIKQDQKHTFKKIKKPLANKSISINFAIILLLLFIVASLVILYFYQTILYHVLLYFFLTLGYSLFLKTIPYLDILLICFGYLIRLDAGSAIISVETSLMLATSVFTLSLFVLSIKRLVELNYQTHKRKSLIYYSSKFLNVIIYLSSFIFLLFSFIFFINENNFLLILFPILIFMLFRYYKLALNLKMGEFPIELVIKDKVLTLACLIVLFVCIFLYY